MRHAWPSRVVRPVDRELTSVLHRTCPEVSGRNAIGGGATFHHAEELQPHLDAATLLVGILGRVEGVSANDEQGTDLFELYRGHRLLARQRRREQGTEHTLAALQTEIEVTEIRSCLVRE